MRRLSDSTAQRPLRAAASRGGRTFPFPPTARLPVRQLEELFRYGAASAVAFAVDLGLLILLTERAGIHYLGSAAIGFSAGIAVAYVLSVRWVFTKRRLNSVLAESTVFVLVGIAGLAINQVVIYSLTEFAFVPYTASKIASAGIVFTFNFSVRKLALFTAPATRQGIAS
jgi:putative flippase GtrA